MSISATLAAQRAVSPLMGPMSDMGLFAQSQLGAGKVADSASAGNAARAMGILNACSVEEVQAMVPLDYAEVLRGPLFQASKFVKHRLSAEAGVEKLKKHQASGTYPPYLATKAPSQQLSGGYADSVEGRRFATSNTARWKAYLDEQLAEDLRAKEDEVRHYARALDPTRFFGDIEPLLRDRYTELCKQRKLPRMVAAIGDAPATTEWYLDPSLELRFNEVVADSVQFMYRVVSIHEQRDRMDKQKSVAKAKISADVDVEMGEIVADDSSIQSRIDKAVAAAIKARPVAGGSKTPYKGKMEKGPRKTTSSSQHSAKSSGPPAVRHYVPPPSRTLPKLIKHQAKKTTPAQGSSKKDQKGKGRAS